MSCIYGTYQFGFEEQGWATWFAIATELGLPITIYGDGDQIRDMLSVEDCVRAYDAFVQSDLKYGLFNLGGGPENTLSLKECINFLEKDTGKRSELIYKDWRPSDQKVYVSDIRALKTILNWEPQISPKEGLSRVIDWVKEDPEVFK